MRSTKLIATALALAVVTTSFVSTAEAGRRHHYGHGGYHHGGYHHGGAFAAGAFGFAAGALLGSAFAPGYYGGYYPYYGYAPRYYYAPRVYYHHAPVYYDDYYYGPCSLPAGQVSRPAWAMCD
jgi:opacity protein-like surface antigen